MSTKPRGRWKSLYTWAVVFAAVGGWVGILYVSWYALPTSTCLAPDVVHGHLTHIGECHQILGKQISQGEWVTGPAGWFGVLIGLVVGQLQTLWLRSVEHVTRVDIDDDGKIGY